MKAFNKYYIEQDVGNYGPITLHLSETVDESNDWTTTYDGESRWWIRCYELGRLWFESENFEDILNWLDDKNVTNI